MAITWVTPAGSLGIVVERNILDIPILATSTVGAVTYSVLAGKLPRGLRLSAASIKGSPTEVRRFSEHRFVIRATDGVDLEDRTFGLSVDGSDVPVWMTQEGFLNVGSNNAYFVLDNAYVNFQLEADDPDLNAGDTLTYYLVPVGGELPPGLSLSAAGVISGYTDPIFAVDYSAIQTGSYDTAAFDVLPLDKPEARSNGFDSFLYDNVTFDYNESVRSPRRISRAYTFIVAVSDGTNEVRRVFRIWVVTEEFLQSDNSILQVDTNLFQADATGERVPLWITASDLGRFRADNFVTIYLDVYDPVSLSGTITYFLLAVNPDGSPSVIPPGLTLDTQTGELAGRVPYQAAITVQYQFTMQAVNFPSNLAEIDYVLVGDWSSTRIYQLNEAVRYLGFVYICLQTHRNVVPVDGAFWNLGVATAEKTFTVSIIGEIESAITWISASDLGIIKPNQPSTIAVLAQSQLLGNKVVYVLDSGTLPPGLEFLSTGIVQGKVKQFADATGPGLTRFFDVADDGNRTYATTFDSDTTSVDKKFTFAVKARDTAQYAELVKQFFITVEASTEKTFANLYLKAFQRKSKRLAWYNFITDSNIFRVNEIYRYGDANFGIQTELKVLVFAGIESVTAVKYVQAMSRNHYKKQLLFGRVQFAVAKDPVTQLPLYEVVYVNVIDDLEKNGRSVSATVNLSDTINSPVLVSTDSIKIDSNVPLVSDSDNQRVFPNSIKNMRARIRTQGDRDREFLPLWMRSIQSDSFVETGYVKALILCYLIPGTAEKVMSRIKASAYDFKSIDFTADRYVIDILNGEIQDKYLVFPQRDILNKLPSIGGTASQIPLVGTFDNYVLTFDEQDLSFDQGA